MTIEFSLCLLDFTRKSDIEIMQGFFPENFRYFFFNDHFLFSILDIRLDWSTFVIEPSDDQLIDLNCYYGNTFPLIDQDGNEVVEEDDEFVETRTDVGEESLIKINLKEHQGQKCSIPFNINNRQMVGLA